MYGSCSNTLLNKVQTIQNKLLKVLFNYPYLTDTNELHSRLGLLKVKDIYNSHILKFVYESINKLSIVQFHDYYKLANTIHNHNTRNRKRLYAERTKTNYGQCTLNFQGTKLWNSLDLEVQHSKSTNSFKRAIKNKFLSTYDS